MHFLGLISVLIILSGEAYSSNNTQNYDRVYLNWSTMRINFFGVTEAGDSLRGAEEQAIKEGLSYIVNALPAIRQSALGAALAGDPQSQRQVAESISKNTYLAETIYYADGKVVARLESSLTRALAPDGMSLAKQQASHEESKNSGVLIFLESEMDPQMIFEIQDEFGRVLYRVDDVVAAEFSKNFMGRFYSAKNRRQSRYYVGKNPVEIKGTLKGDHTIVIKQKTWLGKIKGNRGLLERARIAILTK